MSPFTLRTASQGKQQPRAHFQSGRNGEEVAGDPRGGGRGGLLKALNFQLQDEYGWGSGGQRGDSSDNAVSYTGKQLGEELPLPHRR